MSVDDAIRTNLQQLVRTVADPDAIVARVAQRRDQRRRRRLVGQGLVAAVALVALGLAAAIVTLPGADDDVTAGLPRGALVTTLAVPPPGEVAAEQLGDGTPVWVVRHDDATVSVLNAVSSHQPFGVAHLVGWCPSSQGFEDPQWGSQFDARGAKRGGPAPTGLRGYRTGSVVDGRVDVSGPSSPRRGTGATLSAPRAGAHCHGDGPAYNPGTLELHPVGGVEAATLEEAMSGAINELVLVRNSTILLTSDGATVCQTGTVPRLAETRCDGVEAPELSVGAGRTWVTLTGTFLARVGEGTLRDIVYVEGLTSRSDSDEHLGEDEPVAKVESSPTTHTENGSWGGRITDVRLARQGDVDRLVIEFDGTVPAHVVTYGELGDNVGECSALPSDAAKHLFVTLRGASFDDIDTPGFESGPAPFRTDTSVAGELAVGCDFEAYVHLVLGMSSEVPFRVEELEDPSRLVVELGVDVVGFPQAAVDVGALSPRLDGYESRVIEGAGEEVRAGFADVGLEPLAVTRRVLGDC